MRLSIIDYALWFTAPALQLGILVFMYRRRMQEQYPAFFNYTILQVISVPLLAIAKPRWPFAYYWGYWATVCLSVGLSFFILQEVFRDAFRPFEALRDMSTILFRWAALVLLLVAGMSAVTAYNFNHIDIVTGTILLIERNVRVMLCGLVFFLILFSEYLGISRRHVLFGVAVGFGFFDAINMLVTTAMSHATRLHRSTLNEINSAAYVVACLIWLIYTAHPKTVLSGQVALGSRSADWNEALEDVRMPVPAESLLDTMDKTVEQLLYPREQSNASIK